MKKRLDDPVVFYLQNEECPGTLSDTEAIMKKLI